MLVVIHGAKCIGIDAVGVTVEVNIDNGLGIHLVGLADTAVKESLLRTVTALESLGYKIPGRKIVINLAPADLHKNGSGYDLPIALGIIAASGQREMLDLSNYVIMGELGLDGSLRPIKGALPMAELAANMGLKGCILPEMSALECAEYDGTQVYGVKTLDDVVRILYGDEVCEDLLIRNSQIWRKTRREMMHGNALGAAGGLYDCMDFSEIIGQEGAKRGMEIAAAGGHNVMMIGAPGAGKSSLAKALSRILPPMTKEESTVTSKVYSVAGLECSNGGYIRQRPFRSPHCSASVPALIGGGSSDNIIPGEISLANGGVLFLDEFGQMTRSAVEALRGPLEDRYVTVSRLKSKIRYPASFMLVAASNPCPCGFYGEGDRCTCTPGQRAAYLSRLSGPIMDRIDIQLWLHPVSTDKMLGKGSGENSETVAARVLKARLAQQARFAGEPGISTNAEMTSRQVTKYCPLNPESKETLERILDKLQLSMRACTRIIKVARTIADLEESNDIRPKHIMEAAGFRILDRPDMCR